MDYHINAKGRPLGRVASEIAIILQGKKSAAYAPNKVGGDRALVSNYKEIAVTGRKEEQKIYYHHTGYVGHLKKLTYREVFARDPKRVLREAVRKMLPKNFLNARRLKNLVFVDTENPKRQ